MNDEKIEHLLELLQAEENNDINTMISHFELITNSLMTLAQSLFENKETIKYHQKEIESKFFRFGFANFSLINLMKGNEFSINNSQLKIVDIFSLNSITRMQIESFLIIYYLFFDNVDELTFNFRYDIYKLHGLIKQLNFEIKTDIPEKEIQLKKMEDEKVKTILSIKDSNIYINANQKEKDTFLNPKFAKLIKSEILFEKSGINNIGINKIWQLYSNHAHSEHIGDRQYNSYRMNDFKESNASLIININTMLSARLIIFLINSFSSIRTKYIEISEKERTHIEMWGKIGNN
ncbi:hypothetical protein [Flavobacterium sp. 5]|uniref:hypothetical protein n=1 Tax=Flavobacterium sp. 5 TaxID=2035199 RepID=UPI000C2CB801|nr:hypothetical protein [Flavobacterium sp. 5]PKB17122.1 hypothetical protein CLU82_2303 [Flavobacterium sp. 5]